jgi:tRNA dimethylallyltransferase
MAKSVYPLDPILLTIVGPTASGKSSLAIDLAQQLGGELVNCDSLQLYKGFDIGTAKMPLSERRGLPHHLIDVLSANAVCSAGDYARIARATLAEISMRRRLPIVVGGTGFYLRALIDGLPSLPERDPPLRSRLMAREEARPGALHRLISRLDPAAAQRIHAGDIQKLIRALEIRTVTGKPLPPTSEADALTGYRLLIIGLDPPRKALVAAIAARTRQMFQAGLIEEVGGLLAAGLTGNEKPFEALGYKQVLAHIRGELTLPQAMESTEIETRQYAKRQQTWFRRDPRIRWLRGFGTEPAMQEQARRLVQDLDINHK